MTSYCTSKSTKSGLETGGAVEDESNSQLISNPHNSLTNPHNSLNSNALSCILEWFFVVISVFFHDENAIYPKGPIDRVVCSESITHFR